MLYVLVSGTFETLDTPHKGETFGQQFELPENLARSAILAGAQLVPKDAFDSCAFNEKEIAAYPNARLQADAPATFKAKFAKALTVAADYRAKLSAPPAAAQPTPEVKS